MPPERMRGGVLLEVIFALALLMMTAVFVMNGIAGAYRGADRIRRQASAEDLAVTIASEVQLGTIPLEDGGPTSFEITGYENWTWEVRVVDLVDLPDLPDLKQVEVIIRDDAGGFTRRTAQFIWENPNAPDPAALTEEDAQAADDALGGLEGGLP